MNEENISQNFRLKNINETINYLLEEIKQNEVINRKHKKVCATLNYIENYLTLDSTTTGCISVSAFTFLLGIPIRITSSASGLKICAITAGIKKYKLIIKKKKKRHNKKVMLAKYKINSTEVLMSKAFIHTSISHDEFALINNVLKEYCNMKEKIKNFNNKYV